MRRWFRIWSGHLLAGLAVILFFICGYFAWSSARSYDADGMWWNFVAAAVAFLLFLVVLALSAMVFHTAQDRWYARNQGRVAATPVSDSEEE